MGKKAAARSPRRTPVVEKAAPVVEAAPPKVIEAVPAVPAEIADNAEELVQYDISSKVSPFFDRHLVFKILVFLRESKMYKESDLDRAEIALLSPTNMIDFTIEKYEAIGEKAPESLTSRREGVLRDLDETRKACLSLLQILEDEDEVKRMASYKNSADLCQGMGIEQESITALLTYAKLQYDTGSYQMSWELLKRSSISSMMTQDSSRHISCLWGSLASCLLVDEAEEATNIIVLMDGVLEEAKLSKKDLMVQRTWLLHWTLFAIFTSEKVDPRLFDFFLNEKNLIIMSLCCPHLLRYVGAVLILQKRLKHMMKDVIRFMTAEASSYSDPVTRFLLALYSDMDFDEAQGELQKCRQVCKADYFLQNQWKDFQENSRLLIFETYCRIHQCINIGMIASKLNMGEEEAELWIVKLIQNAKLEARIDSAKSRVVMSKAPASVYQQVIEKTKNLSFRSTMLLSNLTGDKERQAASAA